MESDDEKFLKSCSVVCLAASSAHAKVCGTDGGIGALRRVPNYCHHWDTLSQQHVSLRQLEPHEVVSDVLGY
jgi:hypothetical protein